MCHVGECGDDGDFKVLPAFRWLQPVDAVRGYNTAMNLVLWRVVGAVRGFNR